MSSPPVRSPGLPVAVKFFCIHARPLAMAGISAFRRHLMNSRPWRLSRQMYSVASPAVVMEPYPRPGVFWRPGLSE